ncbi:hypothetical protein SAMN06265376_10259 [Dokdonia pacifica]|uniref:Uncharacterized protein n=1 Tax=Dokdonia pacifica TaxID=1627892 RepID=A0A238YIA5_9FLAO|nr:hypothetical protein SAMN06265376_10259 [Dokdonia pacifica]
MRSDKRSYDRTPLKILLVFKNNTFISIHNRFTTSYNIDNVSQKFYV